MTVVTNESEALVATGSAPSIQLQRGAPPSKDNIYDIVKALYVTPAQEPHHKRTVSPFKAKEKDRLDEKIARKACDKALSSEKKDQLILLNRQANKRSGYVIAESVKVTADFIKRVAFGESDSEED